MHSASGSGRGWSRFGLTSRLLVLVMLPLVVLSGVSGPLALRIRADAVHAAAAGHQAAQVTRTVTALEQVMAEDSDAVTVAAVVRNGFSLQLASVMLGRPVMSELHTAWAATNRTLTPLPATLTVRIRPMLTAVRNVTSKGSFPLMRLNAGYAMIETLLASSARSRLQSLENEAMSTLGNAAAERSVLALGATLNLVEAASTEVRDESLVWFSSGRVDRVASLDLAHDVATVDAAGRQLAESEVPPIARAWVAYSNDPLVRAYDQLLTDGELEMPMPFVHHRIELHYPGAISFSTLIEAYRGVPTNSQEIASIVEAANASVRQQMSSLAAANYNQYDLWLAVLAAAALASLAVALAVARSISRPLGRLVQAAASVVDGNLDVDQLPAGGPRQMGVLANAFNSLMVNLRLLEAKAQALSSCEFDNEVLATPLPGRLGASLQDSVHLLAGSIQDREELQQRLAYEATHDTLTGLLNRAAVTTMLDQALARAVRRVDATAVFYIDLDNFKQANDVHGHQCGDHLLRHVGARLSTATRNGDIVGRLGGDEFIVIAERIEGIEEAQALAKRLIAAVSDRVAWGSVVLNLGASIGVTICWGNEVSALDLLARADLALYEAKRQGGSGIGVYDEHLQARLTQRDQVERELSEELARGGANLVLYFQPLVEADMEMSGVEALLRWKRPGHGLVPPDQFIPIAEQSDLIIDIDKWVLTRAVHQLVLWSSEPSLAGVGVSVNISGRHLLSGLLPAYLAALFSEAEFEPSLFTIEITETVLLNELSVAAEQLRLVRSLGVKVAIDDFGTGYTSLAHLHHLPVDSIKIDRTFVSNVESAADASLVQMITELARHLGLTTVSEGVETAAQFHVLHQLGSDRMQGYLIARPMPEHQLISWSRNRPRIGAGKELAS